MNREPLLTIVIPTRDRLDTLAKVIEHLIEINVPQVKFLICDNFSSISVREALGELPANFLIIRSESRLSMPDNWRFALSKVDTRYVSVIGDDDIIWKKRLLSIFPVLEKFDIPVLFWFRYPYFWGSYRGGGSPGTLLFVRENSAEKVNLDILLSDIFPKTLDYQWMPSIYNSVVSTRHAVSAFGALEEIIPKDCISPDVASAFRISSSFRWGLHLTAPISISGISHNSNGMNPHHHQQFLGEFSHIKLRPGWINDGVRLLEHGNTLTKISIIHDYFCGVKEIQSSEDSIESFPNYLKRIIIDLFDREKIAMSKKLIERLGLLGRDVPERKVPNIHISDTGFVRTCKILRANFDLTTENNEILLVSRYLNSI